MRNVGSEGEGTELLRNSSCSPWEHASFIGQRMQSRQQQTKYLSCPIDHTDLQTIHLINIELPPHYTSNPDPTATQLNLDAVLRSRLQS